MELKDIKLVKGMTKDEVNELTKDYILLEDEVYLGNAHKHNWKCNCGGIIKERQWAYIRSDNLVKCFRCKQNEIEQRYKYEVEKDREYEYIRSYRKDDILPNGRVVGNSPYIQVKHKYCGSIYEIQATQFINQKQKCGNCCGTYENSFAYHIEHELKELLEKYWDFEKNIVNPYHIWKYSKDKVWLKCQNTEYHGSYDATPHHFVKGHNCPYCTSNKIHKMDSFGQYLKDNNLLHLWSDKNTIDPFTLARGSAKKVWMLCDNHVHHNDYGGYEISCYGFYNQQRCSYCASKKVHPKDSFGYLYPDKVKCWHEDNDKSPYEVAPGSGKRFKFRCDKCNHVWNPKLESVTKGKWCPKCKSSKGEKKISEWLVDNNIKYISQYRFKECRNKKELPFDFYLNNHNICIEYDGEQHFKPVDIFDGKEGFERTRIRDNIKNKYCEDNNIKLIRIPYWEFDNIEYILEKELNTYSKIS